MFEVSFLLAFTAGILAFLSPCVLPIIPGYISYISGMGAQEIKEERKNFSWRILFASVLFVLGFSLVFTMLGAGASAVGQVLRDYQSLIAKVGGAVVVFFGLHFAGVFLRKNFLKEAVGIGSLLTALYFSVFCHKNSFLILQVLCSCVYFCTYLELTRCCTNKQERKQRAIYPYLELFFWVCFLPLVGVRA